MHTDCRYYATTEPCKPHKLTRVRCGECASYDPVAERILIVKLDAMGDVLRTTTCLPRLKQRYPRSHMTWVTRASAVPLLDGNPQIDRILSIDSNYLELLLAETFDLAIGPDADVLSASIMSLARSAEKRGFVADGRGGVTPLNEAAETWWRMGVDDDLKQANRRTYGEWLYAMCDLPLPVARPSLRLKSSAVQRAAERLRALAPRAQRWVCFNTGASGRWEEKRWKPDYYQHLARAIAADDPDAGIVLVGGLEETALNRHIGSTWSGFVDGGTDNSIEDFAALVAACDWLLTGDSLGYHIACAVGTPALCLVGPTSPWELDVFAENCVVYPSLPCIACYLRTCPLTATCMDILTPEMVWSRTLEWRSRAHVSPAESRRSRLIAAGNGSHPVPFFRGSMAPDPPDRTEGTA